MLARLESLIAVLRLAQEKAAAAPVRGEAHRERLQRVRRNLAQTLEVCGSARRALRGPGVRGAVRLDQDEGGTSAEDRQRRLAGSYLESGSLEEYRRLAQLGPLSEAALQHADLEALCARLAADPGADDQDPQSRA